MITKSHYGSNDNLSKVNEVMIATLYNEYREMAIRNAQKSGVGDVINKLSNLYSSGAVNIGDEETLTMMESDLDSFLKDSKLLKQHLAYGSEKTIMSDLDNFNNVIYDVGNTIEHMEILASKSDGSTIDLNSLNSSLNTVSTRFKNEFGVEITKENLGGSKKAKKKYVFNTGNKIAMLAGLVVEPMVALAIDKGKTELLENLEKGSTVKIELTGRQRFKGKWGTKGKDVAVTIYNPSDDEGIRGSVKMTIPISVKTSSTNRKDSSGGRYSIITMRTMGMKNLLNYIEKEKSVLANSRIFPFISETYYNMSEEVRISRETNQRLSSLLLATFAWALSIHQNPESSIAEATNDAIKMMVFNNRVIQMKDLYPTYSEFSGGEYRETVDTTKVGKKIKATNLRKGIHAIYDQQEGYNYKELLSIFYQQRNFAIKRKIRG